MYMKINILEEKTMYLTTKNEIKETKEIKQYTILNKNLHDFDIWDIWKVIMKWIYEKSYNFSKDYDIEINCPSISDFDTNKDYNDKYNDFLSSFSFTASSSGKLFNKEKYYTTYKYKFCLE